MYFFPQVVFLFYCVYSYLAWLCVLQQPCRFSCSILYHFILSKNNEIKENKCKSLPFTPDSISFGTNAAQLCMIAVLSYSHRHALDLSPASKIISRHRINSLSKFLFWHTSATTKEVTLQKDNQPSFLWGGIGMHWEIKWVMLWWLGTQKHAGHAALLPCNERACLFNRVSLEENERKWTKM